MLGAIESAILRRCGASHTSTRKMLFAIEEEIPLAENEAGRKALERIAARLKQNLERLPAPAEPPHWTDR